MEVKIEEDSQKLILELNKFVDDIKRLEEPLENSARYMQQQAIANFANSGALMQEGGWPPLSKKTIEIKNRYYPGTTIMVRTGRLKSSFEIGEPIISADSGEIEVSNPVEYAPYHQFSKGGKLPQRILLKFMKQQIEDITRIVERWLDKVINKNV
jgi:phage gpG-like protein